MTDYVIKNYEKFLLVVLLVGLATSAIYNILTVNAIPDFGLDGGGKNIERPTYKAYHTASIRLDEGAGPLTPGEYVYCPDMSCSYLVHKSLDKCPWSETPLIKKPKIVENDTNRNGIPDELEISWGLSLDDVNEVMRDQDGDGFATKDEYRLRESPVDAQSHPSLLKRCIYLGRQLQYVPFLIMKVSEVIDIRGKKRVYVDGRYKDGRHFYLEPGEDVKGFKILAAGIVNNKGFAEFEIGGVRMKVWEKQKKLLPGWPKYVLRADYQSSKKPLAVIPGQAFILKDRSGKTFNFKFIDFDSVNKRMNIKDLEKGELIAVGRGPLLKAPLEE